jgi:hypothetical protein
MVARWWNGKWGHARLDIWVDVDRAAGIWHVTARKGGPEGQRIPHTVASQEDADLLVDRLKTTALGADRQRWRDITETYRPAPEW